MAEPLREEDPVEPCIVELVAGSGAGSEDLTEAELGGAEGTESAALGQEEN